MPPKLTPLVLAQGKRLAKTGEDLVLDVLSNGTALLIWNGRQNAELAVAVNGGQDVLLVALWPHIGNQVDGPLTAWPWWKGDELPLPAPMRLPTTQLAFKALPNKL